MIFFFRRARFLVFIILSLFVFSLSFQLMAASAQSYKKILKSWTRSQILYENLGLNASINWHATLLSPAMYAGIVRELGRIYKSDSDEQRQSYENFVGNYGADTVFFVDFYAYDRKFDDLTDKKAFWRVKLISGEKEFLPIRIEKVKPNNQQLKLFPYINIWAHQYLIYFPRSASENASHLTLQVRGPFGRGELKW